MPRNVRNFWIELTVDGKKTRVATGPRRKDGGFEARLSIREDGKVRNIARIVGTATSVHNELMLITDTDGWESIPAIWGKGLRMTTRR